MKHTGYMDRKTRIRTIGRGSLLWFGAAVAVLAVVSVAGCSKEDTPAGGSGEAVLVRLPGVSLASPVEIAPGVPGVAANSAATHGGDLQGVLYRAFATDAAPAEALAGHAEGLFSVTLGTRRTEDAAEGSPTAASEPVATRADVALTNVWVFQFDASGNAVRCERVDALGAGQPLEVHLDSGEGYTIGVVANGPASGLSTSNVPDLATFREGLLFTSPVASDDAIPYAGTLDGVNVLASGQVQVGGSGINVPYIQLRRIMAQVTVELTHEVDDYALDGVELYSVPVGAAFAPDLAAAAFPAGEDANFGYRDNAAAGLAPHVQSGTGGTDHSYTWYVGPNRRGSGTGITKVQDKNASKAPAYATYARVKTHSTLVEDAPLYYDIYLGEDMLTDFNVTANHIYSYTTRIIGSAAAHYSLIETDGRVSGVKPIHISGATVTPAGDIPGEGKTYSLTLTGVLPSEGVDVKANIEGADPVTGKVTASGAAVSLAVPKNATGAERTVTFEYKWKGVWTQIGENRSQAIMPPAVGELYGGGVVCWVNPADANDIRVVALTDAPYTLKWAASKDYALRSEALIKARNGADIWKIAKQYSDGKTNGASGTFATDFPAFNYCYEKTDGGVPKGTWYLPSATELEDLTPPSTTVEQGLTANGGQVLTDGVMYTSSSEAQDGQTMVQVHGEYGVYGYVLKNIARRVRCMRGK